MLYWEQFSESSGSDVFLRIPPEALSPQMQAISSISSFVGAINGISSAISEVQKNHLLPENLENLDFPSLLKHLAALEQNFLEVLEKHSLESMATSLVNLLSGFQKLSNDTGFLTLMEDMKNVTRLLASFDSVLSLFPIECKFRDI